MSMWEIDELLQGSIALIRPSLRFKPPSCRRVALS